AWWLIGPAAIVLAALAWRDPTLALVAALLLGTAPLVYAALQAPERAPLAPAGTLLLVCALGLLLGTELIFLRDSFGSRMNTVFKFYYHVWLLLGLLSPLLALYLVRGRTAALVPRVFGIAAVALAGVLALGGLLYPLGATAS